MSSNSHGSSNPPLRPIWPMFIAGLIMLLFFWGATELIRTWISTGSDEESVLAAARIKNLQELTETNRTELESYSWADRDKGVVRIPIERAMAIEVAAINTREVKPTYPTDPALAVAEAEAAAAAASPAAPEAQSTPADGPAPNLEANGDSPATPEPTPSVK